MIIARLHLSQPICCPSKWGQLYPRCWCDALTLGIVAWINWGSLLTLIGVDSHWLVDLFDFEAIELPASLEGL
jgi:hypothetical protein